MSRSLNTTNVPVLLTIFNRPDKTREAIEALRAAGPRQVFVAADGPRVERPEDAERCARTREEVSRMDWPDQVHTLFRPTNLGCDPAVAGAIKWFFEHVEHGVIIEDDCILHPDYFRFAEELFERFADDKRIMQISAMSPYPRRTRSYEYHFSRMFRCGGGWGTWRRAWALYSEQVDRYDGEIEAILRATYPRYRDFLVRLRHYRTLRRGGAENWDLYWNLACYANHGLAVVPERNLARNSGFGPDSTHTRTSKGPMADLQFEPMRFPLRHPSLVYADTAREEQLMREMRRSISIKGRLFHFWQDCAMHFSRQRRMPQ